MADDHNDTDEIGANQLRFRKEVGRERKLSLKNAAGQAKSVSSRQEALTHSKKPNVLRALKKGQWMLWIGYAVFFAGASTLSQSFFHWHIGWIDFVSAVFLLLLGCVLMYIGAQISKQALNAISREQDTQAIGHVLSILMGGTSDVETIKTAQNTLLHLLPDLKEEELSRLSAWQRLYLYGGIKFRNPDRDGELQIALLDTFERLKDTRAIPAVQKLLRREVKTGKGRRVHEKAQQCLAALIERSEQAQADTTLLRAANSPEPPTEELLRPATSTQEGAPQQLLRPHEEESA